MITIIFGEPGAGKSALMTYFMKEIYKTQGKQMLASAQGYIQGINEHYGKNYTVPDKVPIYSDFAVKLKVGYEKWYEPYFINGYYFGLPNDKMDVMNVPRGSKVFLSEVQRYYDSRKSRNFPDFVSRAFEMHRHNGLDIYMDTQRPMLVDLNIRQNCRRFIEVLGLQHEYNYADNIKRSIFICREFYSNTDLEAYLESKAQVYEETFYTNEGNIFKNFNSFYYADLFMPPEGRDFTYLPFKQDGNCLDVDKQFYNKNEPKAYRGNK